MQKVSFHQMLHIYNNHKNNLYNALQCSHLPFVVITSSFRHKILSGAQSLSANFSTYSSKRSDFNLHTSQNIMNLQHIQWSCSKHSIIERDMYVQVYVHFHEIKYFVKAANLKFPFYSRKIRGFYEIKDFVYYVKKQ